jgi:uncharacterized protein (DUF3820 family)
MNEICQYVRRSPDTVLNWIRTRDFPAKKIGGVWESDRVLVDDWKRGLIVPQKEGARKKQRNQRTCN